MKKERKRERDGERKRERWKKKERKRQGEKKRGRESKKIRIPRNVAKFLNNFVTLFINVPFSC